MLRFTSRTSVQCLKNQKRCTNKDYNRQLQKQNLNKQVVCVFPTSASKRLFTIYNNNDLQFNGPLKHSNQTLISTISYLLSQAEHNTTIEVPKKSILSKKNYNCQKQNLNKQIGCSVFPTSIFLTPKRLFTTYNSYFQPSGPLKHFNRTLSTASNYCLSQAENDTKKEVQNTGILSSMYGDSYQKQKQDENNKKNEEENKESIQVSYLILFFF